jgi:hypothetical protein
MANAGDTTFEQLWKRLLLYYPECPLPIAQEFINTTYSRLLADTRWSSLKRNGALRVEVPYIAGTVTVVTGSPIVTGLATSWVAAHLPRQFIVGSTVPFYDILSVDSTTQLTLTTNYAGPDGAGLAYSIETVYLPVPSDFDSFISAVDPENNWRLHINRFSQADLDFWDAQRTRSGTSYILANTSQDVSGNRRYEIWPRGSNAKVYPIRYVIKPSLLSAASDRPIFPIRGDVIREGALAEMSLWPGLKNAPNPFYDPSLGGFKARMQLFTELRLAAEREDQGISQTMIEYADTTDLQLAPLDAAFMQAHGIPW